MEEVVLNGLLTSDGFFTKAYSHIDNNLFSNPENSAIFDTLKDFVNQYQNRPSPRDIGLAIKESNKLNNKSKLSIIEHYKQVVKEHKIDDLDFLLDKTENWIKKVRLIDSVVKSSTMIKNGEPFDPIIGMIEDSLKVSFETSIGLDYNNSIEERLLYYKSTETYTPTGLPSLDKALGGGIRPASLWLIIAPTGMGKCHDYNNYIDIFISDIELDNLRNKCLDFELLPYTKALNKVKIKIGDYFKYKNLDGVDKINEFQTQNQDTFVDTPTGLAPIVSMVKKEKNRIIEIVTENNLKVKVAENHLFPQEDGTEKYAIDSDYLITRDGVKKIISKKFIKEDYIYDISIPSPHLYYCNEGILHHNTAFKVFTTSSLLLKKENVLFITLEMPEKEVSKRIDANLLGVTIKELTSLEDSVLNGKWNNIKDDLGKLVVKEYGAGSFNTLQLKTLLDELKSKKGFIPDAIVVDYLGLMVSHRATTTSNSYDMLGKVAEDLHAIAKATYDSKGNKGIKMITSGQGNRSSIGQVDAGTEAISESLKIAMTADVTIFLNATDQMREDKQQIFKIIKNRYTGDLKSLLIGVDFSRMDYKDLADNVPQQEIESIDDIGITSDNGLNTDLDFGNFNF